MAATVTTGLVSLQPSWYGLDLSRRSLGNQPLSLAIPSEPRSRRRKSSGSDQTPHSATMGFNLLKDKVVRRASPSRPRTPLPETTKRGSLDLVENVDDQASPKRSHRFCPTTLRGIKKKRSVSTFFSNGEASSVAATHDAAMVRPASTPPMENKRVSVLPEADTAMQDEERTDGFQPKTHFLTRHGMKHHPYPHDAPYMQAYDPILLDNDRFTEVLLRRHNSNGSPTFRDYGLNPPLHVLDLGCGYGGWVVEAVSAWRGFGTKVTGFDLVDVSSNSSDIDEDLLDNITWVQGNFLKYQLPFADDSFDLVRMANLSLAIPQCSWLPVLLEVRRVLAPGGRLELIDDQILFPYDESPSLPQPTPQPSCSRETASSFDSASHEDITSTSAASTLMDEPTHLQHTLRERLPPEDTAGEWATHAENSRGLETVFESMLLKKYGIHHRPQDIIDVVLSHVFGHKHANQIKSMHLALAPPGCSESDWMMDGICPEVDLINGQSGDGPIDLEETPREGTNDDQSKPIRPQHPRSNLGPHNISAKAADILGIGVPEPGSESNRHIQSPERGIARTGGRKLHSSMKWKNRWSDGARRRRASMESLQSDIPEAISPKAAERLGIAPSNRKSWGSQRSTGSQSSGTLRADHSSSEWTCRDSIISDTDSVKATDCVGISSSTQSSGLILWPSTFIPVEPLELEMHACKHMHVLLGCKAALSDFIQDIKGPDGQAHISQDELNDLTWEYECFRRKRFKWPEMTPSSRLSVASSSTIPIPIAVPTRASSRRLSTGSGTDSAISRPLRSGTMRPRSNPEYGVHARPSSKLSYDREDLTFVRILRVYEAYKPG